MALQLLLLAALALAVVYLTRFIIRAIELVAQSGGMTSKTKGKFIGYATSAPEMVATVGTAGHGLLGAGLWNITASNIINICLFSIATIYYRRVGILLNRKFIDEVLFTLGALVIPLVLVNYWNIASSPFTALGLFAYFLLYLYLDKRMNPDPPQSIAGSRSSRNLRNRRRAMLLLGLGVVGIIITGHFLGLVAEVVVRQIGVPEWTVGWILGVITSLPELTSFFTIYAIARREAAPEDDRDCQENLDSLAASNMSNLGLVYPLGVLAFVLVTL